MAELMGIVQAKLHGRSLMSLPNTSGFPVKSLEPLPLCSLLQILGGLGAQNRQVSGMPLSEDESATASAIETLEQWPQGYHRFLVKLGSHFLAENASTVGLRKQFKSFYEGMFKNRVSAGDAGFLREEFVNFGLQHWGHAVVDSKLLRTPEPEVEKRFISKAEYARRYGIWKPTMDRMIADGTIATKTVFIGKASRVVVDLTHSQVPIESGGSMTIREAAAYLRLPVTILNHLRKLGIYSTGPRRGHTSLWHKDDLERFLAKGLALAHQLPTPPEHSVTLEEVMRLKLRNATAKADIVAALFDGRLAVVGREGETLSELILNKNEIDAFVLQKRIAVEENTYSAAEAAKRTGLDLMAIANAINLGLLTGETKNSRLRVSVESVERFNSEYIPLSRLAPTLNTLTQHLLKKCHHYGIAVIQLPRSNAQSNQPILPRASEAQLLNIWRTESPVHKTPQRDRQSTYADALKTYLESLQRAGKPLPRRAGFPNKAAIAKACKFGRDVLYDYPVVIQLLEDFGRVEGAPTEDSGAIPSGENLNLSCRGQCLPSTEYNVHDKFGMARNEEELSIQA